MRIRSLLKIISLPLAIGALAACSSSTGTNPAAMDGAGKHAVGTGYTSWVQQHWKVYKDLNPTPFKTDSNGVRIGNGVPTLPDNTMCTECHGADLAGGTSGVSCFTASFNGTACHADFTGTPNADHKLGHPTGWDKNSSTAFHGYDLTLNLGNKSLDGCALCHATGEAGSTGIGDAKSCGTAGCHASSPVAKPKGCASCHALGTDTAMPAVGDPASPGAHYKHLNLYVNVLGMPSAAVCSLCHKPGLDANNAPQLFISPNHAAGASPSAVNVVITPDLPQNGAGFLAGLSTQFIDQNDGFKKKYGVQPQYGGFTTDPTAGTCDNVNCHGGIKTPAWNSVAAIDLTSPGSCAKCHNLDPGSSLAYNGPYSGKTNDQGVNLHLAHTTKIVRTDLLLHDAAPCDACHQLSVLQVYGNHFSKLGSHDDATPANNFKNPSATIVSDPAALGPIYEGKPVQFTYNPAGLGSCSNVSCHPVQFPATWK